VPFFIHLEFPMTQENTPLPQTPVPLSRRRAKLLMAAVAVTLGLGLAEGYLSVRELLTRDQRPQILGRNSLADGTDVIELLSPRYDLDQVYISMEGPRSNHPAIPVSTEYQADIPQEDELKKSETLWVTGLETVLIDADDDSQISPEFFCHSNLTFSPYQTTPEDHNRLFSSEKHMEWPLITLVPGKMAIHLPDGFGIPVKAASRLDYFTMALNQNPGLPARSIQMKTRVFSTKTPQKPLFRRALTIYQRHVAPETVIDPKLLNLASHLSNHPGELCAESCDELVLSRLPSLFQDGVAGDGSLDWHPGAACCVKTASLGGILPEKFGEDHTIHWIVPPGHHRYRCEVTEQLKLPFDTTAHYITGHLHPMGTSLRLVEMDSQETIVEITAQSRDDRLGVLKMSEIRSTPGIPIETGKRYELIADYHNTRETPIDAMAILYVYLLDEPRKGEEL